MVLKASPKTLLMTLLISWHFLIYKFCIDKGDHATIQARVGQSVPHLSSTLPIFSIRYLGDETMARTQQPGYESEQIRDAHFDSEHLGLPCSFFNSPFPSPDFSVFKVLKIQSCHCCASNEESSSIIP
ncbi:hypothetical protein F5880DRAFT_1511181 [Lentinula raphanica]|nr:hypothetical protein F5880DRAFT_1511181 [Lentinula raphanica]